VVEEVALPVEDFGGCEPDKDDELPNSALSPSLSEYNEPMVSSPPDAEQAASTTAKPSNNTALLFITPPYALNIPFLHFYFCKFKFTKIELPFFTCSFFPKKNHSPKKLPLPA